MRRGAKFWQNARVSTLTDDFLTWAEDPARTLEERYGILRLVEYTWHHCYRSPDKPMFDWQAMRKVKEKRYFNPAWQPRIDPWQLRVTANLLPQIARLAFDAHTEDRPLRDLSFLAFLPDLAELALAGIEMETLEGLQHLRNLRELSVRSNDVEDYGAVAACKELRKIAIHTQHPWPRIQALAELPCLEELSWNGNGRALADISRLPALRKLHIESVHYESNPGNSIRDLHDLPEMPRLDYFWSGWFNRLDGISRYPALRFLAIRGWFKSLSGLEALKSLSHLRVTAPRLEEVATLAAMPSVQHFALLSERPQDWGVLMESETLREVFHLGFEGDQPDFETLRMLIPSYDDVFGLAEPRPLDPIRLIVRGSVEDPDYQDCKRSPQFPDGPDGWDGHLGMRQSEVWWASARLHSALRNAGYLKLQGVRPSHKPPGVYELFSTAPARHLQRMLSIHILKSEAIGRIPGIFQCIRQTLATMRFPWQVYVTVEPEPDADTWDESWKENRNPTYAEEMEELEREREYQRRRREILLSDQHRLRLLQELGEDTSDFKPTPLPPRPEEPDLASDESDDDDEEDEDDDNDGGIAHYDPEKAKDDESWLPPVDVGNPTRDWTDLFCIFILDETGVHMHAKNRGLEGIAELLDVVPERADSNPS